MAQTTSGRGPASRSAAGRTTPTPPTSGGARSTTGGRAAPSNPVRTKGSEAGEGVRPRTQTGAGSSGTPRTTGAGKPARTAGAAKPARTTRSTARAGSAARATGTAATGLLGRRKAASTAKAGTSRRRSRASKGTRASVADERAWLGQWDSAVTSYYLLVGATTLLAIIGLVMVLSSSAVTEIAAGRSPYEAFFTQARFALMGLPVLLLATRLPTSFYRHAAWPLLGVSLLLQLLIFSPLGKEVNGNLNWLNFGSFYVQPSEPAKLALAVWLGVVLGRKQRLLGSWKHAIVPAVPGALLVMGLVLAGHDLGTMLVILLLVAGAFFVAGVDWKLLAAAGGISAVVVGVGFVAMQESSNRMSRFLATYTGVCDTTDANVGTGCYQSVHGLWALGTGGLGGVGLGASREKWSYLPEAHNDFIFGVIGEELGLLGTLLVLALFAVLGLAMSRVIRRHPDPFVKITTAGIACWIVGQAFINIGVVIGIIPVIGVPLPLVSSGGSALITTMAALGVVISFARDEPGAREALSARGSVVRRSLAVVGHAGRRAVPRRRSQTR
ncbi:putative lipid II flippase FtsW [Oerskovia jenensis]|uniref:Probable peptidoglycan glycosyltransferase FtsW n=1 Tax=Oerskovia jenensis TaxID=162169 RepID=A0ABS2LBB2_9CELL|nr:FtsW/RodA/SpoVE family cell cycle protein [Oerskovia jenensis]MBM7477720.1 cell division protein FtsW [Oerskovia jenensis]